MKTEAELIAKSNAIIDMLHDFSIAEKWRVVSGLYKSLQDVCKKEGIVIFEYEEKRR